MHVCLKSCSYNNILSYICIASGLNIGSLLFIIIILDYEARTFDLTFNSTILEVDIEILITDDAIVEGTETFSCSLLDQGTSLTVITSPDIATVVITEDPSDSKSDKLKLALCFYQVYSCGGSCVTLLQYFEKFIELKILVL